MINVEYPTLLRLFTEHLDPKRSESASFLIWYLENYYRLDALAAVDAVCDQRGDKGVDGIFVNDNDQTITIFQSKINQSADTTIGDSSLREFAGTLTQFSSQEAIRTLIAGAGTARVAALARSLDLENKIKTHELRGEFLSNVETDDNGINFLASQPIIEFVGKNKIVSTFISDVREMPDHAEVTFDVGGFHVAEYTVDEHTKAVIAPIKATELVGLEGIADQSLYAYNVRGPLGKTGVNRDIVKSINDQSIHKLFPLFHNGITVISKRLDVNSEKLTVSGYYVVNGCQSLTSIHENQSRLTDNLRILTKFVQMDPASPWAEMVTHYSNNQNGVKPRDFKSNNSIQIRLQNEFRQKYQNQYAFEIKQGEMLPQGTVISNEEAGLFLMAFDLKEPWATHRKYQVFDDKHADLFGRPEVNADRIVLCQTIMEAITTASEKIQNTLMARYKLTRYFLLYSVREILDSGEFSRLVSADPEAFVRDESNRDHFRECVRKIVDDIVIDLNHEVMNLGDDFDYRDKLRDSEWVQGLSKKVVADHLKLVNRGRIPSFEMEWKSKGSLEFQSVK